MYQLLRQYILYLIEKKGRALGSSIVKFDNRNIVVEGEDIYVGENFVRWLLNVHAFYLPMPPNAFCIVTYPNGTSQKLDGGLHEVPHGLYKLRYVDNQEHFDFTDFIPEMTTDGEKLMLKVIFCYRVIDPLVLLKIRLPVPALIEHIQTDLAQYIRTHDHTDIANSADPQNANKILAFFNQRHTNRDPLSKAIEITSVELKDFNGDKDYVEMRRNARMSERQNKIEKEQAEYQQELNRLKAQHKADNDRSAAEHKAEIENIEAGHEKEKQKILHQVRMQEIELDDKRKHWQRQYHKFAKALEAVSQTFSSGHPMNPGVMKTITDLVMALKEEVDNEPNSTSEYKPTENKSSESERRATSPTTPTGTDKVENLTNTLLNLLNPKK